MEVLIKESVIKASVSEGLDAFLDVFIKGIGNAIGKELNVETLSQLNADQATLYAYGILREEVMDGGFIQLIHNGYGPFFFFNPFAKMMKVWGIPELAKVINKGRKLYLRHKDQIEADCSDEEFMALFEQFPDFDDLDDLFVEQEEEWTAMIAEYVDEHIESFATVVKE